MKYIKSPQERKPLLVSAAASLTDAFREVGEYFARWPGGGMVRFNFAASGTLARQIKAGAPVDVFASAAPEEMDSLQKAGLVLPDTRRNFATNRLVLIAPPGSPIQGWSDLKTARRVAIGQPDSVPAGRYARETLRHRGLWDQLKGRLVYGGNVRQVLAYVSRGEVAAGVVFATDALLEKSRVRVLVEATPGSDHPPVVYPAAVVAGSKQPEIARHFVAFLGETPAQTALRKYRFSPLVRRNR